LVGALACDHLFELLGERLAREMHEVAIETSAFTLRIVCHDLRVDQLAVGDPWTRELTPIEAP
jgi:hypothetical protein